jgi:hypothetical protein
MEKLKNEMRETTVYNEKIQVELEDFVNLSLLLLNRMIIN